MLRAGAVILTFWAGVCLVLSPRIVARFAYNFLQQSKGAFLSHPRFKREVKRSPGARAFVSSVAGARTSEVGL
jgi:hypothetical protein